MQCQTIDLKIVIIFLSKNYIYFQIHFYAILCDQKLAIRIFLKNGKNQSPLIDRQSHIQIDKSDRQTYKQIDQGDRQTTRRTNRYTDNQTDKQIYRQINIRQEQIWLFMKYCQYKNSHNNNNNNNCVTTLAQITRVQLTTQFTTHPQVPLVAPVSLKSPIDLNYALTNRLFPPLHRHWHHLPLQLAANIADSRRLRQLSAEIGKMLVLLLCLMIAMMIVLQLGM